MNYNVLIVDDDTIQLSLLTSILKNSDIQTNIYTSTNYDSANELINSDIEFNVFILDIYLDPDFTNRSGISLARKIRSDERYRKTPIIFITISPDEVYTAVNDIRCFGYLIKPFSAAQIHSAFNEIFKPAGNSATTFQIKEACGLTHNIDFDDILFIKTAGHRQHIHTSKEIIITQYRNVDELNSIFDNRLFRCHRNCLVNPNKIKHFHSGSHCIEIGDTSLTVSRTYLTEFKKGFNPV